MSKCFIQSKIYFKIFWFSLGYLKFGLNLRGLVSLVYTLCEHDEGTQRLLFLSLTSDRIQYDNLSKNE